MDFEQQEQIRRIIREELGSLIKSDRYTFERLIQILDGRNIQLASGTGTKIGTATGQKLGFFNKTPVIQPSGSGGTTGFTAGTGTAARADSTFTGNTGTTAYTVTDVVRALKDLGLMLS